MELCSGCLSKAYDLSDTTQGAIRPKARDSTNMFQGRSAKRPLFETKALWGRRCTTAAVQKSNKEKAIEARCDRNRGSRVHLNGRILQTLVSEIPLVLSLRPESRILLFMWPVGP